jgi:hypothetical protein
MDELVDKRVRQRLGEWTPPRLTESQRAELLAERAAILDDLAKASASLARRGGSA